jgi:hypothetical protein
LFKEKTSERAVMATRDHARDWYQAQCRVLSW